MKQPVVIIGIGEMGGVFARAFLREGYPVFPITRAMDMAEAAVEIPEPLLVLLAVAEKDLSQTLESIPLAWRPFLVLLQNELLPHVWQQRRIENPTIISVWFEKKRGTDVTVLLPSPVYGPMAKIIATALDGMAIPCTVLQTPTELENALVTKNTFVLTINTAGLQEDISTGLLWEQHRDLALAVAQEVIALQEKLINRPLDLQTLLKQLGPAMLADPDHKCKGRAAPDRLVRALKQAETFELHLPKLEEIRKMALG